MAALTTLGSGTGFGSSWGWFVAEFDGNNSRLRTNAGADVTGAAGNKACGLIRIGASASFGGYAEALKTVCAPSSPRC